MSASKCPYAILGINLDATEDDVVKAHRRLILTHHPDKTDDPTATTTSMRLNDAKERALRIIAERKEQRQTEIDLDTHVLTLKQYIMQTVFEPIPIAAALQTKIRATVADCKGRAGRRSGPNPEIDAYYLYVKNLIGRIRMEEDESQNKMNKSNQRIAVLQARLDAETAARERAEKVAEEKEHIIDALTIRIKELESNADKQANLFLDSMHIDSTISLLQEMLLHHEQTITALTCHTFYQKSFQYEPPSASTPKLPQDMPTQGIHQDTDASSAAPPPKRKRISMFTASQAKNHMALVEEFIKTHLEMAAGNIISSQSIKDAFEQNEGKAIMSSDMFFKNLKHAINSRQFPSNTVQPVNNPSKGYRGLKLKS